MSRNKNKSLAYLNVRVQTSSESRLGWAIRLLEEGGYDLTREVVRILEARFFPVALKKYKQELDEATILECLGELKGFVASYETVFGINGISVSQANHLIQSLERNDLAVQQNNGDPLEEELTNGDPPIREKIDFSNKMFDLENEP